MSPKTKRWVLGGGALLGILFWSARRRDPDADIDALTKMILTETDFAHDKNEMAQIVFVALNRMKRHDSNAFDVVTGPMWCHTTACRARFDKMRSNPKWSVARAFVQSVVEGQYPNRNFTAFIHPAGMPAAATPTAACARNDLVASATIAGPRCIPTWAVGGTVIGQAMFAKV